MNDPAQTKESGIVIALAVLGLVLGILALLGSLVPLIGIYAFYLSIPAVLISLFAVITAYSTKARKALPIGAFVVGLVAVGISAFQYMSIVHLGNMARKDLESKGVLRPSARTGQKASPVQPPKPKPPLAGKIQTGRLGPFLLPASPSDQNKFPLLSNRTGTAIAFATMPRDDFDKIKIDSINDHFMTISKGNGERDNGILFGEIEGFEETYHDARQMDMYTLAEQRPRIIKELLDIQANYKREYRRYLNTVFTLSLNSPVKESSYNIDSKTLRIFVRCPSVDKLKGRRIFIHPKMHIGNRTFTYRDRSIGHSSQLSPAQAREIFSNEGAASTGQRSVDCEYTYYIKPSSPERVGFTDGSFDFEFRANIIKVTFKFETATKPILLTMIPD